MIKIRKLEEIILDNIINLTKSKSDHLIYLSPREEPILIVTPALYCKNGLIPNKSKYSTHELNITLSSITKDNSKLCEYFFESLDQKLVELGKNNKDKWPFNNKDKILYKSIFEEDDLIKFKLINSKEFNTLVFDELGHIISVTEYSIKLSGEFYAKLIFELVGIWIKDNKYGVYVRLYEIRIVDKCKHHDSITSSSNSEINCPEYILSDSDNEIENKDSK